MSTGADNFSQLIEDVRRGSEEAAWQLVTLYGDMVYRVVRRKLPQEMRRLFDSRDFAQLAWGTIFRHRSRLQRFSTPEEFMAFLATVAANKVRMEVRARLLQQKHNLNRERLFDSRGASVEGACPRPSQMAIAHEAWCRLLGELPAREKKIVRLSYLGYSTREIGRYVGLDESSVRRILRKIHQGVAR